MTDRFKEVMREIHELLANTYGDYVAHALDFKEQATAEAFITSLSFTTGQTLQTLNCPDRIKVAPVLLPNGVFVVLGGQLTPDEHEEIRRKADEFGVQCKSMCIADDGSKVQRDFMMAAGRLKGDQNASHKRKWWQLWK